MSDLEQRVAYLRGLASGFNLREGSREGQVLADAFDVLDLMASAVSRLEARQHELESYMQSLDEDLAELEEDFYGEEDVETCEITCPDCGATVEVEEDDYDEGRLDLTCPECGALIHDREREQTGLEPGTPHQERTRRRGVKAANSPGAAAEAIRELGAPVLPSSRSNIHCLTIIGQIEGHMVLPPHNKTTKLVLLNAVGGDVEAGLAIAEAIASMSKPTVSVVLGGGRSIGVPIAVAADCSFIASTAGPVPPWRPRRARWSWPGASWSSPSLPAGRRGWRASSPPTRWTTWTPGCSRGRPCFGSGIVGPPLVC